MRQDDWDLELDVEPPDSDSTRTFARDPAQHLQVAAPYPDDMPLPSTPQGPA